MYPSYDQIQALKQEPSYKEVVAHINTIVETILKESSEKLSQAKLDKKEDIERLVFILQTNGFTLTLDNGAAWGKALFDKSSNFGHSCSPNTVFYLTVSYDSIENYSIELFLGRGRRLYFVFQNNRRYLERRRTHC